MIYIFFIRKKHQRSSEIKNVDLANEPKKQNNYKKISTEENDCASMDNVWIADIACTQFKIR